jgi:hypothetical protein
MPLTSVSIAEAPADRWTPAQIRGIAFIRRWQALFGDVPRAADLNPSAARNCGQEWRIERYRAGDPQTGAPFLSLNALKEPFDGSLTKAIRAAGFEPAKPGPRRRAVVRGREVDPQRLGMHPEARAALEDARAGQRVALAKLEVRDRQLAAARDRMVRLSGDLVAAREIQARLRARPAKGPAKPAGPRVDGAQLTRVRAQAANVLTQAAADVDRARARESEARQTATRLAARLERAEATVNTVRAERAQMRGHEQEQAQAAERLAAEVTAATDRAATAQRQADELREQLAGARARPPVVRSADRVAVDAARAQAQEAQRAAAEAELRAVRAERRERELAALVAGEPRQLNSAEIAALRGSGPAGPAMLAAASRAVAKAHGAGGRVELDRALRQLAAAAETWRGRL